MFKRDFTELQRGGLKVKIAPELGGRIMQFSLDGFNFLFVNPALEDVENIQPKESWNGEWLNFGGEKIWVAPQGWNNERQWSGPPDRVLDGGYFKITQKDEKTVSTQSSIDPKTGLRIERKISLLDDECGLSVDASFENFSEESREWSIWSLSQMTIDDFSSDRYVVTFPSKKGFKVMHGIANNPQYSQNGDIARVDYKYIVGKIGAISDAGWLAYVDTFTGKTFVVSFDYIKAKYPEDANVQVWSSGKGTIFSRGVLKNFDDDKLKNPAYLELEVLSPLEKIDYGKRSNFSYKMRVCTLPQGESVCFVNSVAAFSRELSIQRLANADILISASFGSFAEGMVILKDESGREISLPIAVSPSKKVEILEKIASSKILKSREIILEYFNDNRKLTIGRIKL